MADKKISALTASTTPLAGTEVLPIVQGGSTVKVSIANVTAGRAVSAAQLDVDNVRVDGNTISTTNTDGNLTLDPNGTGFTILTGPTNGTIAQMGNVVSRTFYIKQTAAGGFDNDTLVFESDSGVGQYQWKNSGATLWSMNRFGNLAPATAGTGIDFSANGGDILSQYDEGTWTPTFAAWTTAPSVIYATYTRIGRQVTATLYANDGVNAGGQAIAGLPFTSSATSAGAAFGSSSGLLDIRGSIIPSSTNINNFPTNNLTTQFWQIVAVYFV